MDARERYAAALVEVARRKALCEAATPGLWRKDVCDPYLVHAGGRSIYLNAKRDAEFIAAHDPALMLRVWDVAEQTLREHVPGDPNVERWLDVLVSSSDSPNL